MRRLAWSIVLALLAGFGLGVYYSWTISPLRVVDAEPIALRSDFKDEYRQAIAAAYAASGNLPRARARLALLKDSDPIEALNAQAQRMMARGDSPKQADQVAALSAALGDETAVVATQIPVTEIINNPKVTATLTLPPPPPDVPLVLTETVVPLETPATAAATNIPRPTRTAVPTLGAPFKLIGQDSVCDPNLPEGLLQVIVLNSSRRQLAGIQVNITWEGGEEQFFTGLKPELGNGYADYLMTANTPYTVQLALGSDIATGLLTPTCQSSSGESFSGGIKLTFQQP